MKSNPNNQQLVPRENTMSAAVATIEDKPMPAPIVQRAGENNLLAVIARVVTDPALDVEKMQRLLDMQMQLENRQSQQAFSIAMNEAQTEMRAIGTDSNNSQTKSKYASFPALDRVMRPIYAKHGFALSFDTGDVALEGCVRVLCYVSHSEGHSRTYHVDMPADGKGAKGGDVMTKTHATGAALTYGQRYLLKLIFNIAVGDDDDGNGASEKDARITAEQTSTLREMLERHGSDIEKFCAYFGIEAVPDLKAKDYERAVAAINLRDKKVGGSK